MHEAGPGRGRRKIRLLEPGAQGLVKRRSHRVCFPRKPGSYRHHQPHPQPGTYSCRVLPRPGTCLRSERGVAMTSLQHNGIQPNAGTNFRQAGISGRSRTPLTADQVLGSEWKSCSQPTWLVVTLQGGHLTSRTSLFLSASPQSHAFLPPQVATPLLTRAHCVPPSPSSLPPTSEPHDSPLQEANLSTPLSCSIFVDCSPWPWG